jgi:hypothetical protein
VGLLALLWGGGTERVSHAQNVSKVTGPASQTAAETSESNTAETVVNVAVLPNGNRIETVLSNDDNVTSGPATSLITYTVDGRTVFPGAADMGWDFRVRSPAGDGPWTHMAVPVPNGTTSPTGANPFNVVWGDPAMASNADPSVSQYVFMGGLAMATDKFNFFAGPSEGNTPGKLTGVFGTSSGGSPLSGACIYLSRDGGQSVLAGDVACIRDETNLGVNDGQTFGHYYDGGAMAVVKNFANGTPTGHFSAYYAAIDYEYTPPIEAIWTMPDVTSTPLAFVPDPTLVGNTGAQHPLSSLDEIDTHVQLRASPDGFLWKMSASFVGGLANAAAQVTNFNGVMDGIDYFPADLKINIRNRNGSAYNVATNAVIQIGVDIGVVNASAPGGESIRTAQDFDFDVGLNEEGQTEMRYVYIVALPPTAAAQTGTYYLQGGLCVYNPSALAGIADLTCANNPEWVTPPTPTPQALFPAIRFGQQPGTNVPSWTVTYQQLTPILASPGPNVPPVTFAIYAGNFTAGAVFEPVQVTPTQTGGACPDVRAGTIEEYVAEFQEDAPPPKNGISEAGAGYWGDYDAMGYDPVSGNFVRAFTDSTQGCPLVQALNSHNVNISEVEIPALLSCTTENFDVGPETAPFNVDTGFPPLLGEFGSNYGQPTCQGQLVVEVNLNASALVNQSFVVTGQWTEALVQAPCPTLNAVMNVYARPTGTNIWQLWDQVRYGNLGAGLCSATALSHTNPLFNGQEGTTAPPGMFAELRIAISATETLSGQPPQPVAVDVSGALPSVATGFTRSYSAFACTRGAQLPLPYTLSGAEVGNQGGDVAFCPLMSDSTLPLNGLPSPTVFLNGDFTIATGLGGGGSIPITVEGCFIDSQTGSGMNCGVSTTVSTGNQRVRVETRTWAGQNEDDAFFIYVDVGNENFATLWSYDTE